MRIDRAMNKNSLNDWAFVALFFTVASMAFSISLFEIFSWMFISLCFLSMARSKTTVFLKDPLFVLAVIYFAMSLLSLTQSHYLDASLRGVFKVLKNILLCFSVVYVLDSDEKFKKTVMWLMVVALVIAADALIQGLTGFEPLRQRPMTAYVTGTQRLTGPFGHANDFSAYLSFVALLYLGILRDGLKVLPLKKFIFCLTGFLLVAACLIGTYSRGAWVAVILASVLFILFKKDKLLMAALVALVAAGFFFAPAHVKARAASLWDVKDGTIRERKILWEESRQMICQSPWLGLGVNTYARNEPFFKSKEIYTDNQYAHNGYLQMAAEIGILGLLSFLALLGYFFWGTLVGAYCNTPLPADAGSGFMKSGVAALVFAVLSFLLHSATDTDLQSLLLVNTLWLGMGVAWAGKRCVKK